MAEVVVGVDGSDNSVAALRWAAAYAKRTGDRIRVITTWEFPAFPDTSGLVTMPGPDVLISGAEAVLDHAIREAEIDADVEIVREIIEGHPARVLLDHSTQASLLVVGRRGHSGVVVFFTGSVATACANRAEVPVVIVPSPART
jgi:nucleotide-binding universal stress UspA family protein